jgi:proteasome component ECM29
MDIDRPEAEDKFAFPKFASLVQYFRSIDTHREDTFTETQIYKTLGPNPFAAALPFLKRIAIWEAIGTQHEGIKIDEDWDRNVDTILETDETSRSMVEAFFQQQDPEVVAFLLDMAWEAMINDREASLDPIRGIWGDIAALVHQDALVRYAEHLPAVLKLITSPKTETRHVSAQSFGLLGSSPVVDNTTLGNVVISLVAGVSEHKSGFVLAFGYLLSRIQMRGRMKHVDTVMLQKGLELIATLLSTSRDGVLIDAATEAICELSVFNVIQKDMIDIPAAKKTLLEKSKKGHEKSVQTLGSLGLLYAEGSSEIEDIIKDLITLGETGGVEMSFVVGEALSTVAAGWGSSAVRRRRHINGVDWASGRRDGVKEMLDLFLKRANESAGGGKRRATVVGLLSILQFCTAYDTIKERLTEAQLAFRMFLTDRDGMDPPSNSYYEDSVDPFHQISSRSLRLVD